MDYKLMSLLSHHDLGRRAYRLEILVSKVLR